MPYSQRIETSNVVLDVPTVGAGMTSVAYHQWDNDMGVIHFPKPHLKHKELRSNYPEGSTTEITFALQQYDFISLPTVDYGESEVDFVDDFHIQAAPPKKVVKVKLKLKNRGRAPHASVDPDDILTNE